MSQRDLVAELRAARTAAPPEVRERVRLVAAAAPPPTQRFTWRRALVVAVPVAAAIAAAVVLSRPTHRAAAPVAVERGLPSASGSASAGKTWTNATAAPAQLHAAGHARAAGGFDSALAVPVPRGRATRVGAYLSLQVKTPVAVSDDVKRAVRVATSLGGYASAVHASTAAKTGIADLTLKVPRGNVSQAMTRLASLGTITGENVSVEDVQAGLNAADRRIAKLQAQLRTLRAQQQTPSVQEKIAALTAQVQRLQRGEQQTLRSVADATIALHIQTKNAIVAPKRKHGHGPLHGLGVAFRWIGIGAIYALALGAPLVVLVALLWLAARALRRRREDALLST